ncbi:hypothetical protein HPG69_001411 [Diceros bicornis minor]|uniref:Mucin-2-like n=1 Tax=Diceros bicornis minor TaxID=77932 RepID=A0A7J7FFP5_DICBM|nr:hypothetical protein HPG69_001411 [Diceros bicornis minor]
MASTHPEPGSHKNHTNPFKKNKTHPLRHNPIFSCKPKSSRHPPFPVSWQPISPQPTSFITQFPIQKPETTTAKPTASTSTNIVTSVSTKSCAKPTSAARTTLSDAPTTEEIHTSSPTDTTWASEKMPEDAALDNLTPSASTPASIEYFASISTPCTSGTKSVERVTTTAKTPTPFAATTSGATSISSSTTLGSQPTLLSQSIGTILIFTTQVTIVTTAETSVSPTIIPRTTFTTTTAAAAVKTTPVITSPPTTFRVTTTNPLPTTITTPASTTLYSVSAQSANTSTAFAATTQFNSASTSNTETVTTANTVNDKASFFKTTDNPEPETNMFATPVSTASTVIPVIVTSGASTILSTGKVNYLKTINIMYKFKRSGRKKNKQRDHDQYNKSNESFKKLRCLSTGADGTRFDRSGRKDPTQLLPRQQRVSDPCSFREKMGKMQGLYLTLGLLALMACFSTGMTQERQNRLKDRPHMNPPAKVSSASLQHVPSLGKRGQILTQLNASAQQRSESSQAHLNPTGPKRSSKVKSSQSSDSDLTKTSAASTGKKYRQRQTRQQTLGPQKTSGKSKLPKNKTVKQHPSNQIKTPLQKQTNQKQYNFNNSQTKQTPLSKPTAKSSGQNKPKETQQQTSKLRPKKSRNHQLGQSKPDQISLPQTRSLRPQNNTKLTAQKNLAHSNLTQAKYLKDYQRNPNLPQVLLFNRTEAKPKYLHLQMVINKQSHSYQTNRKYPANQNFRRKQLLKNSHTKKQNDQRKHHFNTTEVKKTRCSKPKTKANGQKRHHQPGQPKPGQKNGTQNVNHLPNHMSSTAPPKINKTKSEQGKSVKKFLRKPKPHFTTKVQQNPKRPNPPTVSIGKRNSQHQTKARALGSHKTHILSKPHNNSTKEQQIKVATTDAHSTTPAALSTETSTVTISETNTTFTSTTTTAPAVLHLTTTADVTAAPTDTTATTLVSDDTDDTSTSYPSTFDETTLDYQLDPTDFTSAASYTSSTTT